MNFTAIDFETATSKYTSICSMGICVVENNEVVERKGIYIRPTPFEFNDYNIKIHGITPEMVEDMPTFDQVWDEIKPYIEGRTIVAHNAMFDVGALCATLDEYGISYPSFKYLCTVKLSQKAYPELPSHRLNNLCDALGISFNHHQAYDDAYACAEVLINILEDCGLDSIDEIESFFEVDSGVVYPGCKMSFKQKQKKEKKKKKRVYRRKKAAKNESGDKNK
jgi:DNA polymerase-3 subunit epsilon